MKPDDLELNDLDLQFKEIADPRTLTLLDKINGKLTEILTTTGKFRVDIPHMFQVFGKVSIDKIDSLPPVQIKNLSELNNAFIALANQINELQRTTVKAMQAVNIKIPNDLSINNEIRVKSFDDLLEGIEELKKGFNILINKEAANVGFPDKTIPVEIQNWMIPQPVTNVSLNPNRGTVMATAVTVTSALTPLPGTALADRRSLTIYNNSASTTIYVGGANVTSATGIPVPAGTYGPSLDAGPRNIVYAVTAGGSADIRVLEMNDLMEGGDA